MQRPIYKLKSVRLCSRPSSIPQAKNLSASQKEGLRYEARVADELRRQFGAPKVAADQWFEYLDGARTFYACIDAFVLLDSQILVVESKLTYTNRAWTQLEDRYCPLLKFLYNMPVIPLQACRNLTRGVDLKLERTPRQLAQQPRYGRYFWHWLGKIPEEA